MNELSILTDKSVPNQNYTIESAALNRSDLIIVIKEGEKDEFLDDFIHGKTAFPIFITTDSIEIRVKRPVSVRGFLSGSDGSEDLLSFIIDLSLKN